MKRLRGGPYLYFPDIYAPRRGGTSGGSLRSSRQADA